MAGWNEGGGFETEVSEAPPPISEASVPETKVEAPLSTSPPEATAEPIVETLNNETGGLPESTQTDSNSMDVSIPETDVAVVEPPQFEAADVTSAEAVTPEPTDLPPPSTPDTAAPHHEVPTEPETLPPMDTRLSDAGLADMAGMDHDTFAQVLSQEHGARDAPDTYLSPDYVDQHLAQFEVAHRLQNDVIQNGIGNEKDGYAFVTPHEVSESDLALRPEDGRVHITMNRLDDPIKHIETVKAEMPSGNEESANNADWRPGGHDRKGEPEAVMNLSERPVNRLIRGPLRDVEDPV